MNDRQGFRAVVDDQTLAGVVNGKVALQNLACQKYVTGIVDKLARLCSVEGLRPPLDHDDPVERRPREYNKRADQMCNMSLDGAADFVIEGENLTVVMQLRPHILIYTDGSCRRRGISAIGYVIYAILFGYTDINEYYTLAMGGHRVDGDHNSFTLEAWALDKALSSTSSYFADSRS